MTSLTLIEPSTAHDVVPPAPRLRLLPSGDGWSLVTGDGRLVFSALGLSGAGAASLTPTPQAS